MLWLTALAMVQSATRSLAGVEVVMRRCLYWLVVVALISVASPAVAGKIGFVSVEQTAFTVDEGQAKAKEITEWIEPRQARLKVIEDRVAELRQQIAQQRQLASPEALKRLEEQELEARRQLEDGVLEFQRDHKAKQEEMLRDVAVKINIVVNDYAKTSDYDAVFIIKDTMLIYLAESADLTETVIRLYNQRFPVARETASMPDR